MLFNLKMIIIFYQYEYSKNIDGEILITYYNTFHCIPKIHQEGLGSTRADINEYENVYKINAYKKMHCNCNIL